MGIANDTCEKSENAGKQSRHAHLHSFLSDVRGETAQTADSDEAAPLFRDDCAPGFRDDLAPCLVGSAGDDCC
ncbi:hypothetical protein, partial [Sinorhizobium meliloti]|uniref:hypothetical protein n=1 Tax=Rhizobium meliloti TaxID=382 RepID=UPI001AEC80E5